MRAVRAISALVVVGGIAGEAMAEDGVRPPAEQAAIVDAVEHGLAPAVLIAGAPTERRSLTDEMARLQVPGISIAVLQGGTIAWAKGYRAAKLAGEYQVPNRGMFSIADDDGQLTVSLKEGVSEPLYAMSANNYFVLSRDMLFHIDDSGPTPKGRIVSGAFEMDFTRIP